MVELTQEQWTDYALGAGFTRLPVLIPIRDRLLEKAQIREGDVVLDVGCGDGLVAFAAVERVGQGGQVIFSDIAQGLVDHCRNLAEERGLRERCAFLRAPMNDLSGLADASVDVITARSVLNHVPRDAKARAFRECYRVLRPGGRLSTFQPINRFAALPPEPPGVLRGYDVGPVQDLAEKVKVHVRRERPVERHTSLHYDERDLFELASAAGFQHIDLEYAAWQRPPKPGQPARWATFVHTRHGPGARELSLHEAMQGALTPAEAERLTAHLRPLVESGRTAPYSTRFAQAYLWAIR